MKRMELQRGWFLVFVLLLAARPVSAQSNYFSGIACGANHTLAVKSNGVVLAAGLNGNGQLGLGDLSNRWLFTPALNLTNVTAVEAGDSHSLALSNGIVWAWGNGANGRLGDGTTDQRTSPVQVTNLSSVIAVAAGGSHSMALCSDGNEVWCWGLGTSGQLGSGGTPSSRTTPVKVGGGQSNFMAIAAGAVHSLGLKTNSNLWAWGGGSNGQLGTGDQTDALLPVRITSNVVAIAAGSYHSLAVKGDGSVRAWGLNSSGQIGDNTVVQRLLPTVVVNLSDVQTVAAGAYHSLALLSNSTVVAWGNNSRGQLGLGDLVNRRTNTVVSGLTNIVAIAAGDYHSFALRADGALFGWGDPGSGALGDIQNPTNANYVTVPTQLFLNQPPTIVVSPISQTMAVGSNVTFSVTANGQEPMSYQWRWNGSDLTGEMGTSLTRTNLQLSDAGDYGVVITNVVGSVTSSPVALTVMYAPTITRQPESETVAYTGTACFKVSATGTEPLSYQWRFNGTDIEGATSPLLILTNVLDTDAGDYSVIVSNAAASVITATAILGCFAWDSPPPLPEGDWLDTWTFDDSNWVSQMGAVPLMATNVACVPSWSTNAVEVDSNNPAILQYPALEVWGEQSWWKVFCDYGSFDFWFKPNWSSTNVGGTGPGSVARLIDVGAWTADATHGWWSLWLNPDGTRLSFSAQADGLETNYLSAPVSWASNEWYYIALTYAPTGSALYIDGRLMTNGAGVTVMPSADVQTNGFRIGSDTNGMNQARGQFENLWTWDYPLADYEIWPEWAVNWPTVAQWSQSQGEGGGGSMMASGSGSTGPDATAQGGGAGSTSSSGGSLGVAGAGSSGSGPMGPLGAGPSYSTNDLWLEITGVSAASNTTSLVLNGTQTGQVYELMSKLTLTDAVWTIEGALHGALTQTPTNVPVSNRTNALLLWARNWTGIDENTNGLPDWWEWEHFGYLGVDPDADPDDDGTNNLQEYQNGNDPLDNMLIAWGDDRNGQSTVSWGFGAVVGMAGGGSSGGGGHTLALVQGAIVAWGANDYGQTTVPAGLTDAVAVAAGGDQSVALKSDGTVAYWGHTLTNIPSGLTDVTAISAGYRHVLALRADGTVTNWGRADCTANTIPTGLGGVKAISAGWNHNLALCSNGTVVAWGWNGSDLGWNLTNTPGDLTNIVAISAGALHSVALRRDGTVVAWGYNGGGETNVPPGLSGVTAIAAGRGYTLAQREDGTVTGWGMGVPAIPSGLDQIKSVAAGPGHAFAVRQGVLAPIILRQPRSQGQPAGGTAVFQVSASSRRQPTYQWQYSTTNNGGWTDIPGATTDTCTVADVQASDEGFYRAAVGNGAGTNFSTAAQLVLVTPPVIISPVTPQTVIVPAENTYTLSVSVTNQGSQFAPLDYQWYQNGQATSSPPSAATLTIYPPGTLYEGQYWVVVSNIAGSATSVVWTVSSPGSVAAWGRNDSGQTSPLIGVTNVIGLAGGGGHTVALREDGTVLSWGANDYGQTNVPSDVSNVVAVAAGFVHSLALRENGTVVGWGRDDDYGQTNTPVSLTDAIAISAGGNQSLALRKDGSVVQWGQTFASVPTGLSDVTAIATGTNFHLALLSNATVVAWGANDSGQTSVPTGLTNVVAIAAGGAHALALKQDGTVVAWGSDGAGESTVAGGLSNVMAVAAGNAHSVALRNDGTVVAWGDNTYGQTNAITSLVPIRLIAAGSGFSLASGFSELTQYLVDVTKDLLLIYNSNSSDSSNLCAYYLAHRPMVANANALGVACDSTESTTTNNCESQIIVPMLTWLTNNPTKHPEYVVLFFGIPTRFSVYPSELQESVSYYLRDFYPGFKPFVTYINANTEADCKGYVDKLANMGANLPGRLILSASTTGYGNTNYLVDNIRYGGGTCGDNYRGVADVSVATNGLMNNGVFPNAIMYADAIETCQTNSQGGCDCATLQHPATATNLAGYLSWGAHSSLGPSYALDAAKLTWLGNSGWWIIETMESYNGQLGDPGQGTFAKWFSSNAFGGTNYSNTPVGAVSNVEEPKLTGCNNSEMYFGFWASGKNFAICAWNSRNETPGIKRPFQAIGDPFVTK